MRASSEPPVDNARPLCPHGCRPWSDHQRQHYTPSANFLGSEPVWEYEQPPPPVHRPHYESVQPPHYETVQPPHYEDAMLSPGEIFVAHNNLETAHEMARN